jgi:hypothetical protein
LLAYWIFSDQHETGLKIRLGSVEVPKGSDGQLVVLL